MSAIHSYPKVHQLGHAAIRELFVGQVVVQEKVDGSQISFSTDASGTLHVRSKSATVHLDNIEQLFTAAVEQILDRDRLLVAGYTYRGEYLAKPKHNALAYDRVPMGHIALFDVNDGLESYLPPEAVQEEAERLGFEAVPTIQVLHDLHGVGPSVPWMQEFLGRTSFLGGQKIEGLVFKNYSHFTADGHAVMGKFVSEAFKEVASGEWKKNNPGALGYVEQLVAEYRTPARWQKAVQHLAERGELQHAPQDIGRLMKEVGIDTASECEAAIKEKLWKYAWPRLQRGITSGLAEWYKLELAKTQLEEA